MSACLALGFLRAVSTAAAWMLWATSGLVSVFSWRLACFSLVGTVVSQSVRPRNIDWGSRSTPEREQIRQVRDMKMTSTVDASTY